METSCWMYLALNICSVRTFFRSISVAKLNVYNMRYLALGTDIENLEEVRVITFKILQVILTTSVLQFL